jgi:hypothetical protein
MLEMLHPIVSIPLVLARVGETRRSSLDRPILCLSSHYKYSHCFWHLAMVILAKDFTMVGLDSFHTYILYFLRKFKLFKLQ